MEQGQRTPAIEGWFTDGDAPALLGLRCEACATVVFPPRASSCPNPACRSTDFATTALSRTGRIWSYATNYYPPPEPYVAAEPFQPYTVAAVELDAERLVVLGQMTPSTDAEALRVGAEVELVVGTLYSDADGDHTVWQWQLKDAS